MPRYKSLLNLSKRSLKRRLCARNNIGSCISLGHVQPTISYTVNEQEPCSSNLLADDNSSLHSSFEFESFASSPDFTTPTFDNDYNNLDIIEFLRTWAVKFQIKQNALNILLVYLKKKGFTQIPDNSKTLLKTPQNRELLTINPGVYFHIGVKSVLQDYFNVIKEPYPNEIYIDLNIDGLPVTKSTKSSFWLILANIKQSSQNIDNIETVGIYHGDRKPDDFCDFLRPLVHEFKLLSTDGFHYENHVAKVHIRSFICDTPALAAIKGIKSHSGYFGCGKCIQEGNYINHKMTFPEKDAALRTDENFRLKTYEEHHRYISPLEELSIDMINDFPLDYLHLVCLGIVKKLLNMWCNSRSTKYLFSSRDVQIISEKLILAKASQPAEFQRRIRTLKDLGYFKGSEFRTFLMYTGPIVLHNILGEKYYNHFLKLHVSIKIFCDEKLSVTHITLAEKLLQLFVDDFSELYGEENVIYNVHNLIHLANDVRRFGNLNTFSAFPFESYMYRIKKLLRTSNQPLAQVANRLSELKNVSCNKAFGTRNFTNPVLKKKKLLLQSNKEVYKTIVFEKFKLSANKKDSWFQTKNLNIVEFEYAQIVNNKIFLMGREIASRHENVYTTPISSTNIGIFKCEDIKSDLKSWSVELVDKKLFAINLIGCNIAFFPLPHSSP